MSQEQLAELTRLKQYFPFRVIYGALKDGKFESGAVSSKRIPNQLAREGWQVWILQ